MPAQGKVRSMRNLLVVLGIPIDNLTMAATLERCDAMIAAGRATGRTHQITTVNADFVVNSLHDPELRHILQEADLNTADGMPLVWASRLLGGPLPGRVTGADLVPALAQHAAERGYSIFFLGARPGVAAQAAAILQERHPGLKVAGVLSPPPASVLEMDRSVMEMVRAAQPDILLVAFGNPKQEKWIRMYAPELQVPLCIGIGGTLDMIAGVTQRAPVWMQRVGLEWSYRLLQEPRRLFKRYVHDFVYFGMFFARQWWVLRDRAVAAPAGAPAADPAPAPTPPRLPGVAYLELTGRIDAANHTAVLERAGRLLDEHPSLMLDLAGVTFLDSTALGALVALTNRARTAGGNLWLVRVPPTIQRIFTLVRLDHFFEILPDSAAVAAQQAAVADPEPASAAEWTIVPTGRTLDAETAPAFVETCLHRMERNPFLIVDLSATVFLASAGMAALLKLDAEAQRRQGELRIVGCSADVLRTLHLVRLDALLTIVPTLEEAARPLPAMSPSRLAPVQSH